MGKFLLLGAVACGVLACILAIVALSSSSWITGCIPYDNILGAISENPEGTELCLHLGLFKVYMKAGNVLDMSMSVDILSIPRVIMFGVVALTMAATIGAIGVILLLTAASGNHDSYEAKGAAIKRTRAAMILLVFAGLAGVVGMAAYTGGTAQVFSDPLTFLANFGSAAGSSLQNNPMDADGLPPETHVIAKELHPSYGYSYAVGWISVVIMIIAAALAAVAKQHVIHQTYNGPSSMKF